MEVFKNRAAPFGAPVPLENCARAAILAAGSILDAIPRIASGLEASGYSALQLRGKTTPVEALVLR